MDVMTIPPLRLYYFRNLARVVKGKQTSIYTNNKMNHHRPSVTSCFVLRRPPEMDLSAVVWQPNKTSFG